MSAMMITEAELLTAAKAKGAGVMTLTDQLAQWKQPGPWHENTVRAAAEKSGYNKTTLGEILEQVKMNGMEKFTSEELHVAGAHLGATTAVSATIGELGGGAFSAGTVIAAASIAGWNTRMQEVLAEARRLRKPVIANDDDVLTVGELSAAMKRKWGYKGTALQREVDALMADIVKNREPEYPEGIVVRDKNGEGDFYRRNKTGWTSFGGWNFEYSIPIRPLKVMS